jgi:hypothetical protein
MKFSSVQFLLRPEDGSYAPEVTAKKKTFLDKCSVVSDCRINNKKYIHVFCMPTGKAFIKSKIQ